MVFLLAQFCAGHQGIRHERVWVPHSSSEQTPSCPVLVQGKELCLAHHVPQNKEEGCVQTEQCAADVSFFAPISYRGKLKPRTQGQLRGQGGQVTWSQDVLPQASVVAHGAEKPSCHLNVSALCGASRSEAVLARDSHVITE